jgi:hypothetical protein
VAGGPLAGRIERLSPSFHGPDLGLFSNQVGSALRYAIELAGGAHTKMPTHSSRTSVPTHSGALDFSACLARPTILRFPNDSSELVGEEFGLLI